MDELKKAIRPFNPGREDQIIEIFKAHGWKPGSDKDIRRHELTGYLVDLLKVALEYVSETNKNNFVKGDIAGGLAKFGPAAYGNFPHLRYFGLIAHPEVDGVKQQRRWLITKTGGAFLRGEYEARVWVKIKDNRIVERSEQRIDIKKLGHTPMQSAFEYFNRDTGQSTGIRPGSFDGPQAKMFDVPEKRNVDMG